MSETAYGNSANSLKSSWAPFIGKEIVFPFYRVHDTQNECLKLIVSMPKLFLEICIGAQDICKIVSKLEGLVGQIFFLSPGWTD